MKVQKKKKMHTYNFCKPESRTKFYTIPEYCNCKVKNKKKLQFLIEKYYPEKLL